MGIMDMLKSKVTNWPPTLENSGRGARSGASVEEILATAKPTTMPLISAPVEPTVEPVAVPATTEEKPVDNPILPVEPIPQDKDTAVNYLKKQVFGGKKTPYLVVMQTYGKLGEFIEDESKRVKAALALEGIDENAFLSSMDDHISDLSRAHGQLKEKAKALLTLQTESFRGEIETQTTKIAEIDEQVTSLNLTITRLLAQKSEAAKRVDELKAEIAAIEDGATKTAVLDDAEVEIRQTMLAKKTAIGR